MDCTQIEVELNGPDTIIRFNRAEVMNCIGMTMHNELVHSLSTFRDDDAAKVAPITGAGDDAWHRP